MSENINPVPDNYSEQGYDPYRGVDFEWDDWRTNALCREEEYSHVNFYPTQGEDYKPAQAVCGDCEVESECLDYAIDKKEKDGVWGGATAKERTRILRAMKRAMEED